MAGFIERMIRAARLDVQLYEEVEADKNAMAQAMAAVIFSSVAAGVGSYGMGGITPGAVLMGILASLAGWFLWAYLTYIIGTKLLPEPQTRADYNELLRTIGFSSSPGMIRLLGVIPGLSGMLFWIANVWMLVAMVIAVRQALDYQSTWRAVGVCAIGWFINTVMLMAFFAFSSGAVPPPAG